VDFQTIIDCLSNGELIAYPTEAVYGLGCDPFNELAVNKLLKLKRRSVHKGLILITHDWQCIAKLTQPIPEERLIDIQKTWPGPFTWLFPASEKVPKWIRGQHDTVALRVTAHPIARQICLAYGKPIVSTSANLAEEEPVRTTDEAKKMFDDQNVLVVEGEVGQLTKPTEIADALTGRILRK
jgi:L-threonylcarbamoyladenylate synthase